MKRTTTKELFKQALSKANIPEGTNTKLVEVSCSAGCKWSVKIGLYLEEVFVKHLIVEL